ncbi:MAG: glucan biosynthesis protein [Hyphomicrobiaceae bacterium]
MSSPTYKRRDMLQMLLMGVAHRTTTGLAALCSSGPLVGALAQIAPAAGSTAAQHGGRPFGPASVSDLARQLAASPYRTPQPPSIGALSNLGLDESAAITLKPGAATWAQTDLPFAVEPLHRSKIATGKADIYLVEGDTAAPLSYDASKFDFGKARLPEPDAQIGFSGLQILHRGRDGALRPVFSLRDASYFMAIAQNQVWGLVARPLTVRSPDQKGEESPQIKAVWIEKPTHIASALMMHALVDTPSLAGAFRFTLRAGEATVIDTECTIFTRKQVEHFGLAPIQATYLFGTLDRRNVDDIRPNVHEIDGVQMLTGKGEWIWRPVTNRSTLQISAFVDSGPRGFGLLQRNRQFADYLDDESDWHRRPSLWIEPIGDWGQGEVTLTELPGTSQNNKNIACYWRPKTGLEERSQTFFAYRQFWSWTPPERPDTATVTATRTGRVPGSSSDTRRRFVVQFGGEQFSDPSFLSKLQPNLWASGGRILSIRSSRAPDQNSYRVVFDLDSGGRPLLELRLALEADGEAASETWLYRWTP